MCFDTFAEYIHNDVKTIAAVGSTSDTTTAMQCIDNANGVHWVELMRVWIVLSTEIICEKGTNTALASSARRYANGIHNGNFRFKNILRLHTSLTANGKWKLWTGRTSIRINWLQNTLSRSTTEPIQCWLLRYTLAAAFTATWKIFSSGLVNCDDAAWV